MGCESLHFTSIKAVQPKVPNTTLCVVGAPTTRAPNMVAFPRLAWRGPLIAVVAAVVGQLLTAMPSPYAGVTTLDIAPDVAARFPSSGPVLEGRFAPNEKLRRATRLFEGQVIGAESVAVSSKGELIMLDKFGYVHRARSVLKDGKLEYLLEGKAPLYIGPGRPLGYHVSDDGGSLLVCDSLKGLVHVDLASGRLTVLANSVEYGKTRSEKRHVPINYANDLDVGTDGKVYFTSSTELAVHLSPSGFYDTMRSCTLNLLRGDASGRLLEHDPVSGKTREVLGGLFFANGVAVVEAATSSFVAVVETAQTRVLRHWTKGPKAGTTDVLISDLPGAPDGISRSSDGNLWLCLIVPNNALFKWLAPHPTLRQLASHALVHLAPVFAKPWGCVVKVSPAGEVLDVLFDTTGERVAYAAAVSEFDGKLFIGNLAGNYVSVYDLRADQ